MTDQNTSRTNLLKELHGLRAQNETLQRKLRLWENLSRYIIRYSKDSEIRRMTLDLLMPRQKEEKE